MSVAAMRIRLAIDEVGELSASRAALNNVSVTVFRQSTHVPNTSKNRPLGCVLSAIVDTQDVHRITLSRRTIEVIYEEPLRPWNALLGQLTFTWCRSQIK